MYSIPKKMAQVAWKVLENADDYRTSSVNEAADILMHYEDGATYDRKPAAFNPVKKKRRTK